MFLQKLDAVDLKIKMPNLKILQCHMSRVILISKHGILKGIYIETYILLKW